MTTAKGGRPSTYSAETVNEICQRISNGESLRSICRSEGMPDKVTVLRWLGLHEGFRTQYAQAREAQADHWAEEIIEISDEGSNDFMQRKLASGEIETVNHEHIARSRLRVDARKWLMAKMAPKKYGDRLTQDVNVTNQPIDGLSEDELRAAIARIRSAHGTDGAEGAGDGTRKTSH